jgi:hypothetical protein
MWRVLHGRRAWFFVLLSVGLVPGFSSLEPSQLRNGRPEAFTPVSWESHLHATNAAGEGGTGCDRIARCDRLTGCIAPERPKGTAVTALPKAPDYARYIDDLQIFLRCREEVLLTRLRGQSGVRLASLNVNDVEKSLFPMAVLRLNGDIFWAPASESRDTITNFGDEARAVFGPIPDADCSDGVAKSIPLEVEGNIVDLKPNPSKPNHPLEFEHRDPTGAVVAWTTTIPKCDKPSLAGNVTYCGLNSRLARVVRGNVEWLTLCRKSGDGLELSSDPYWQASNPKFALLGTIGFNRVSGEIVFFDGKKTVQEFDWSKPFVPPGGHSYADVAGRTIAQDLYDRTFQIECYACHDNKNAYVVDPHAELARIGYFGGSRDPRAVAFSLGAYLPETSRGAHAPFRVIGTGYTAVYGYDMASARTVRDPNSNCTGCHTLTTQVTGRRFAADAVGMEPFISAPNWPRLIALRDELMKFAAIARHRTDWALLSGPGKIHPWMVPNFGNDLSEPSGGIDVGDWGELSNCLWNAGGSECGYQPLYTPCPPPESTSLGDSSQTTEAGIAVLYPPVGEVAMDRMVRLEWKYLNAHGNVPERDDVRFNVTIREVPIPLGRRLPAATEYPSEGEAEGKDFKYVNGEIGVSGSANLIQNASYAGHIRWTDPVPATVPRDYRIDFPGRCNRRYLVRILPKRFCFDQSNVAYSSVDHVLYADVLCN